MQAAYTMPLRCSAQGSATLRNCDGASHGGESTVVPSYLQTRISRRPVSTASRVQTPLRGECLYKRGKIIPQSRAPSGRVDRFAMVYGEPVAAERDSKLTTPPRLRTDATLGLPEPFVGLEPDAEIP